MDTVKGILLIAALVLAASTFLLFVQWRAAEAQLEDATEANALTRELLRVQGATCRGAETSFEQTSECIRPLLLTKDFKEDGFGQPKTDAAGYLVIKNINRRSTYESGNFTFLFNREPAQRGCHIPGSIGYNVACRFEFSSRCADGDVLEVMYQNGATETKIFTKNC